MLPGSDLDDSRTLPLVEKQVFKINRYETFLGEAIDNLVFGWEYYGTLNGDRDNAILVFHHLHGYSHAAGKYRVSDKRPGSWDGLIGPGKPLDTDRYFVISVDSLCNVNAWNPDVVTTGPASINPRTGKHYGPTFPIITYHDILDVQMALLDHLGIERLHAALGVSAGGHHCLELATVYPDRVSKIIPVASGLQSDAWLIAWANVWISQLRLDPNWNGGFYYEGESPQRGLVAALKMITMIGRDWSYTNDPDEGTRGRQRKSFGRSPANPDFLPAVSMEAQYLIEADLDGGASRSAKYMDANHFHYLAHAAKSFTIRRSGTMADCLGKLKAEVLMIHHLTADHLSRTETIQDGISQMLQAGVKMEVLELSGTLGHIDFLAVEEPAIASSIRKFIDG